MIPVTDGIESVRRLRINKVKANVLVIMLIAKDDKFTEEKNIKLDVDAFMPKPFDLGVLLLRVNQLLKKKEKIKDCCITNKIFS